MKYPAIFLKSRLDDLYDEAARSQGSWEASKLLCLGGAIASGAASATNPLMGLFSIGAGLAYGWAIVKEGLRSMRFKPLPVVAATVGDILSGAAGGDDAEPLPNGLKYLPPEQATEVILLEFQAQSAARFLSSIDEPEREQAYKQMIKYFHHQYGAIAQHRPSLLFNSDSELREAFDSALSFPVFEEENMSHDNPGREPLLQSSLEEAEVDQSVTSPQAAKQEARAEIVELDLAAHLLGDNLGQDLKSILIMGESGAGKGNLIYGMSAELLRVYPDSDLYAVNPKPAKNESARWQKYRSVLAVTDEDSALGAFEAIEAIEAEMVHRQQQGLVGNPYVLVLDEFNTLLDLLNKEDRELFIRKVKRIIRQGRSNRVWLWIGAQTGNCDDIGVSAPDRTNLIRVAVGFQGNCDALQIAISNASMFPGLKKNIPHALIPDLKSQGFGIAAASVCDRIYRLPNYLSRLQTQPPKGSTAKADRLQKGGAPEPSENLFTPLNQPEVSEDLLEEYRDILSPPPSTQEELPSAEKEISAHLKKIGIRKNSRQGIAIFKVWKWCTQQPPSITISLKEAWERFRKDRKGRLTKPEVRWSLQQLYYMELIDCPDIEDSAD